MNPTISENKHPNTAKRLLLCFLLFWPAVTFSQPPADIRFTRQGVQRMLFDEHQSIVLSKLEPGKIIGMEAMHPVTHYGARQAAVHIKKNQLVIGSVQPAATAVWLGGFNPFATYILHIDSTYGRGAFGFEFSDPGKKETVFITLDFENDLLKDVKLRTLKKSVVTDDRSVAAVPAEKIHLKGRVLLQLLGSGFVIYFQDEGLPEVIGQGDFKMDTDLRSKQRMQAYQSHLYLDIQQGAVTVNKASIELTTGTGLADIRAITYENGDLYLDKGRIWYTMSVRGRALPHHLQGVFSMDPSVFDIKLEGLILFDRNDGLLRNEIASHIFYDRKNEIWRGITTGFSAFANPGKEKKELLAVESKKDPRFGFSIMNAQPFGIVGDIEDPHILYDEKAKKWRLLTCENQNDGYRAVLLESRSWNKNFKRIAGPVPHNSTGTSIQKINGAYFCFSGSSDRKIYIYTYPDLKESGILKMDLPPWSDSAGTRVWPNVVQLPEGYPAKFVALMMDRFNYPGINGPNWTYGALYLYHGNGQQ